MNITDRELLSAYLAPGGGNDDAFRALVDRYLPLIYATARRQAPPHLADDIAQAVFILLAKRAHTLRNPELLPAWLLKITRYCAANARRADQRRQRHEQKAAAMIPSDAPPEPDSPDLSPHLDLALRRLSPDDRTTLILRYYNDRSIPEISLALNISESAAKKRLVRALETLRKFFLRKHLAFAATLLVPALAGPSRAAIPHLTAKITAAALAKTGASAAYLPIARGALHMMTRRIALQYVAALLLVVAIITAAAFAAMPRHPATPPLLVPIAADPPATAPVSQPAVHLTPDQNLQRLDNAKAIAQALSEYADNRDGHLPDDIGAALRGIRANSLQEKAAHFLSPADAAAPQLPDIPDRNWINQHTSFIYLGNSSLNLRKISDNDTSNLVIVYEKLDLAPDGRVAIGFLDGHGEFLTKANAQELIKKSKTLYDAAAAIQRP